MKALIVRLLREEEGATALEYALLAVLIALVMAGGAVILGEGLNNLFGNVGTEVDAASAPGIPTPAPPY